jgi:hypothetical protein
LLVETEDKQALEISRNGHPFPIMAINCPDIEYTHRYLKSQGVLVEEYARLEPERRDIFILEIIKVIC